MVIYTPDIFHGHLAFPVFKLIFPDQRLILCTYPQNTVKLLFGMPSPPYALILKLKDTGTVLVGHVRHKLRLDHINLILDVLVKALAQSSDRVEFQWSPLYKNAK